MLKLCTTTSRRRLRPLIGVVGEGQKVQRDPRSLSCEPLHDRLKKRRHHEVRNADPEPAIR